MATDLDNLETYRYNIADQGIFKDVNPPMATLSKVIVLTFLAAGAIAPEMMGNFFSALQDWIKTHLGWYYILAMCLFMFFVFWLIVTPYGRIRLGGDETRPEFGNFAWFSMLFGAGMGIGLLFWSVAESMYHIQNSPFLPEGSAESMAGAPAAMQTLWLHWGLHAWAVYVIVGPTVFVLGFFLTNLGGYLDNFIPWGFFVGRGDDADWQGWWTVFYWGWWMAWAPFVGMFIARVSRGRTIREFCVGVLIVPILITFFWFAVMGGTGLYQEFASEGGAGLIAAVNEDISKPLFVTIGNLGTGEFGTIVMSLMALVLIITYFVTSSDSGTLVVTTLISMGKEHPPVSYRVFWGLGEGAVAAILLYAGGCRRCRRQRSRSGHHSP